MDTNGSSSDDLESLRESVLGPRSVPEVYGALDVDEDANLTKHDLKFLAQQLDNLESNIAVLKAKISHGPVSVDHVRRHPERLRPWMINNMLILSLVWQVINVTVIFLTNRYSSHESVTVDASIGVMLFFQTLHVLGLVMSSVKLAKQVVHQTVRPWFLVSSYGSVILLFGGIYTLVYRLTTKSFGGVPGNDNDSDILISFVRLTYFSVTVMTTVGLGDIFPATWWSCMIVGSQMLISVVYTVTIFAKGIASFSIQPGNVNRARTN